MLILLWPVEILISLFAVLIYSAILGAFSFKVLCLNILSKNGLRPSAAKATLYQMIGIISITSTLFFRTKIKG
jgi:hypothetical protein